MLARNSLASPEVGRCCHGNAGERQRIQAPGEQHAGQLWSINRLAVRIHPGRQQQSARHDQPCQRQASGESGDHHRIVSLTDAGRTHWNHSGRARVHAPMRRAARLPIRAAMLPAGLVALFLLSSCARFGANPSPTDDGQIRHPAGDALVFRIENAGGFVPPQFQFISVPSFSLTGDGRVIVEGAQTEIYPGHLVPPLNVRTLTEAGLQSVLELLTESGQFGSSVEWRGAQNFVADASDTIFSLHAGDRELVVKVYGLGTFSADEAHPGLSAAEAAAHEALTALMERLTTLDGWLPASAWADDDWQPYAPTALRLVVRNADADPPDDSGIGNTPIEWPGPGDPAAFGSETNLVDLRCGVVAGEEAQTWNGLLATANELTRFTSHGHTYEVGVRPLLPEEPETCSAL